MKEFIIRVIDPEEIEWYEEEPETPELIRCKDCKHQNWVNAETGCIVCKFGRGTNAPDWFCADGERK